MPKDAALYSDIKTAVSLFSGAGGMDLGIIQAGFDVLACVEIDPHCCDTLREAAMRERRNTQVREDDIRAVEPEKLMHQLLLLPGELDLLCGGSPCQSFSQIGKRNYLEDERGMLLFEFVRFAQAFSPKAIMIEQVKGLLNAPDRAGQNGGVYALLDAELKALGYETKMRIIKAVQYGVPQMRERVFIVATKNGQRFEFPEPTHGDPKKMENTLFSFPAYVTVGEALQGLGAPMPNGSYQPEDSHLGRVEGEYCLPPLSVRSGRATFAASSSRCS